MGNALSCYEDTAPENSPEEKDPLPRGGGGMLLSCCNGGLLWNQIGDDDGDESSDRVFIPDGVYQLLSTMLNGRSTRTKG